MKILLLRRLALPFVVVTLTVLLSGCVATVGEYGYYDGGDIGATYYEPPVVEYGDWGPNYYVAPFRGGERRHEGESHITIEGGHAARSYRSAPASHAMPSIPSRSRSGGSQSHPERKQGR